MHKTNRRNLLLGMAGISKPSMASAKSKPLPNQCPLCGTMAQPYVRDKKVVGVEDCEKLENNKVSCTVVREFEGESERWIRCGFCSNIFAQDSEDPKSA